MAAVESDSSLLFGILALQNGLIEQPDLIAAFQCWCKERSRSMAQVLVERGSLSESDRSMLDGAGAASYRETGERGREQGGQDRGAGQVTCRLL